MVPVIIRTLYSRITGSNFWKDHCIYLPAMIGWFIFSASLSSYNKIVFGKDNLNFPFPLLMTSAHFGFQWLFSYSISNVPPPSQSQPQSLRQSLGGFDVAKMDWITYLSFSVPCGIVTASDVGLSNLALVHISLTFYTMVKASSPIFVVASAFLFRIERITTALIMVVLTICAGEVLTVLGEAQFDLLGFFLCLSAAVLSGFRWTVVQLKLSSIDPPLKSTIATMRLLSPVMFGFMFLFSMVIERPWDKVWGDDDGDDDEQIVFDAQYVFFTMCLSVGGASLAIVMIICEFYLIMHSSAIVLMIGGVLKEIVTIMTGVIFFGNNINSVNLLGCIVVFLGVLVYKFSLHINKLEKRYNLLNNETETDDRGSDKSGSDDNDISYGVQSANIDDNEHSTFIYEKEGESNPNRGISYGAQSPNSESDEQSKFVIDDFENDEEVSRPLAIDNTGGRGSS